MGILDFFRKKKNAQVEKDPDRHYKESRDYFKELNEEEMQSCPQCAKAQKHVLLVKSEGETMECPECHYMRQTRRM